MTTPRELFNLRLTNANLNFTEDQGVWCIEGRLLYSYETGDYFLESRWAGNTDGMSAAKIIETFQAKLSQPKVRRAGA